MTDFETLTMLRDSARAWVAAEHPVQPDHETTRNCVRPRWQAMADLGWTGITIPHDRGGLELGLMAFCVLAEELGRELVAAPMLSSGLLAAEALPAKPELIAEIIAGRTIIAPAFDEGPHHGAPVSATAYATPDGWRLSAAKRFVLDGADADWFLVSAVVAAPELFLVPRDACAVTALDTIDGRSMAHIVIDDELLPNDALLDGGCALIERLADLARLALAAEMAGAASRVFEITLDYLKTRTQFGRPIGSFQALQHRAAQILVDIELARACITHGFAVAEDSDQNLAEVAATAKYMAGEALHRATSEAVQMHGGIGMTAEHVAGRYLKWARVTEALFGDASWLARRYANANNF